jgi:hypothetical protein
LVLSQFFSIISKRKEINVLTKLSIILVVLTQASFASIPDNDKYFPLTEKSNKSTSNAEKAFYKVIEDFTKIWKPIIKKETGKELFIAADWQDPSVNASMTRDMSNNPIMKVSGGILRHPNINRDSFIFMLCHELGHYMGGAPKAFRGRTEMRSWSSVEGQADYYAASKCLPITFAKMPMDKSLDKHYKVEDVMEAKNICKNEACTRIVLAGLSAGKLFADATNHSMPELYTRSRSVAWETMQRHPEPQCRVDTVIAGALCEIDPKTPFDDTRIEAGACRTEPGSRPACWFNLEIH